MKSSAPGFGSPARSHCFSNPPGFPAAARPYFIRFFAIVWSCMLLVPS
jgi:hypothetical protein